MNTPEWPHEASGTSGMKAVANGVLHASVPDGWWAEGHAPGLGFTLGSQELPHDDRDSQRLLELLEQEIVPLYYDRGDDGLPREWIATMRRSMTAFISRFSTRRMLEEYSSQLYDLQPVTA
jgi:starch phosphorylase